jgi:hypothetical protein
MGRQGQPHHRAAARGRLRHDRAAVAGGDLAHHGQAQARAGGRAGRVGAVEAVEDERQVRLRDARPVIPHGDLAAGHPHLHRAPRRPELDRVVEQVLQRDAQPLGAAVDDAPGQLDGEVRLRPVPPGRLERVRGDRVQVDREPVGGRRLAPGQVGHARHQAAQLSHLVGDPGEHLLAVGRGQARVLRQHVRVDPQAGERRAQLMAGVADQPPLGVEGTLQRTQHRVEGRSEPAELVAAAHLNPPPRVAGQRDLLGDAGQPGDRGQPGPRDGPAEQAGDQHADRAEQRQRRADLGHLLVSGRERLGHLQCDPGGDRGGQHHRPGPVDLGDRVELSRLAGRHVDRRLARGEQPGVTRRGPDHPRRGDELGVGGHPEPRRVRRNPAVRDVPLELVSLVHHAGGPGGDLGPDLVLQVRPDREEGDGGDRERDRRHRARRDQGEPGLQGEPRPLRPPVGRPSAGWVGGLAERAGAAGIAPHPPARST